MYITKLEALWMEKDEEVSQFHTKLSNLVNSMKSLGKDIPKSKVVQKVLRSLLKRFRPKVTMIAKNNDLKTIKLEELIDSLQMFEAAIKVTTKKKCIVLIVEEPFRSTEDFNYDLALVAKKFKKILSEK